AGTGGDPAAKALAHRDGQGTPALGAKQAAEWMNRVVDGRGASAPPELIAGPHPPCRHQFHFRLLRLFLYGEKLLAVVRMAFSSPIQFALPQPFDCPLRAGAQDNLAIGESWGLPTRSRFILRETPAFAGVTC